MRDPNRKPDVFSETCPSRAILTKIANKWSMLVIDALSDGPMRNNALMRRIGGVSQKMLTETLRTLTELQLVERRSLGTVPPHVEYSLTPLGRSLLDVVSRLDRWIERHMPDTCPNTDAAAGDA